MQGRSTNSKPRMMNRLVRDAGKTIPVGTRTYYSNRTDWKDRSGGDARFRTHAVKNNNNKNSSKGWSRIGCLDG